MSRKYVWIYSAVQYLFIVLFTHLFYRYVREKKNQPHQTYILEARIKICTFGLDRNFCKFWCFRYFLHEII